MLLFDEFCFALNCRRHLWAPVALAVFLGACSSPKVRAPVEERTVATMRAVVVTESSGVAVAASPEGAANRPGFYTVKPGDTLMRIALEHGQNWRDIARWNNIAQANVIEVGHVLRVLPPQSEDSPGSGRATKTDAPRTVSAPTGAAISEPMPRVAPSTSSQANGTTSTSQAAVAAPVPVASSTGAASAPAQPASAASSSLAHKDEDSLIWAWPAGGSLLVPFEEGKTKGVALGGKQGDPVWAAGDGRVVYAGSGLRGYGNLVILKHNNTYLTAYAHNSSLLVKEDQVVRRGQKIAEMGSSDADRVQLHFEVRRQGKPVDPLKFLPPR